MKMIDHDQLIEIFFVYFSLFKGINIIKIYGTIYKKCPRFLGFLDFWTFSQNFSQFFWIWMSTVFLDFWTPSKLFVQITRVLDILLFL